MISSTPHTVEFGWVGVHVRLSCDSKPLADMVRRLWGLNASLIPGRRTPRRNYVIDLDGSEEPVFRGPGGERFLDHKDPALHAYNLLVSDLLGIVRDHFVFHATSVGKEGRAVVLSGPTTFGKTTLGIHLANLGFDLLADDLTIVERGTGRILPFRRLLRLRPGTRRTLDDDQLERAREATREILGDEWAVDPGRWFGEAPGACSISMVAILRPHTDGEGLRSFPYYEIRVTEGQEAILRDLEGLEGIRSVQESANDPAYVRVEASNTGPLIRWLRENHDSLVYGIKQASGPPEFDGEPRLEPLGPFQAALELCQEMLNRHEGSILADEFRQREVSLVTEVAERLGRAQCFALLPGRLEDTLQLLTERFESAA